MEIHALAKRGWTVSAIARHTERDRKTIRKYLREGEADAREPAVSCLEPFRGYIAARFADDPHLQATVLLRELADAGFDRSYPTLVRELRRLQLRPICPTCQNRHGVAPTVQIEHPAGEEIQWDWLELDQTPWGAPAYVLVGALAHSGRFRGVICEQMTLGHLAWAAHRVLTGLGGTPRVWRTDRMATIVTPGTKTITVGAANLAKHYGVELSVCPPRRPQRKGVVEKAIQLIEDSWWRSAQVATVAEAQSSLDRWTVDVADRRRRGRQTVCQCGAAEPLLALPPAAYPALIEVQRKVSRQALVAFESNHYSVPPAWVGRTVTVRMRVGEMTLQILASGGEIVAEHRRAPAGSGQLLRSDEHAEQLTRAVLAAFSTEKACRRKANLPPGDEALAELAKLKGITATEPAPTADLAEYQRLAGAGAAL